MINFFYINPESLTGKYIRFLMYARKHKKHYAAAIFGMVLYGLTDVGFASLVKPLFDDGLLKQNEALSSQLALFLLLILLLRALGAYISNIFLAYITQTVTAKLRAQLFHHIIAMPITYFDTNPIGTLVSKCTYNVGQASAAVSRVLVVLVRDTVTVTALLAWLLYVNWMLTLVLFLAVPVIVMSLRYANRRFRTEGKKIQDDMGFLVKDIEQVMRGIRAIKIFATNGYASSEFNKNNDLIRRHGIRFERVRALSTPIVLFVIGSMFSLVVYLLTFEQIIKTVSIGDITSFFVALIMLMKPVRNLMNINSIIQQGLVAIESLFDILDTSTEFKECSIENYSIEGKVEFKDVGFKYSKNEQWALKNINFTVNRGQMVAIVGQSGAGKTTLLNMLTRFYDSSEGCIEIDSKHINDIPLSSLRDNISYVGQDAPIFHDTLRNNITYGRKVSDDELHRAMEKAHMTEFVNTMPDGVDTVINAEGNFLSAGQSQRVAIARALLKPSAIIIFDEATSFLDAVTESIIKDTLVAVAKNATTFVIAHRLSTVENADFILVMESGEIIEKGNHSELMEQGGAYARLYRVGHNVGLIQ